MMTANTEAMPMPAFDNQHLNQGSAMRVPFNGNVAEQNLIQRVIEGDHNAYYDLVHPH